MSEVVVLWYMCEEQQWIADNFNNKLSAFHITYLGMPLSDFRSLIRDFEPLMGVGVSAKAEPWCGRFIS